MQCPQRKLFNPLGRFPRSPAKEAPRLTADLAGLLSPPGGEDLPLEGRPESQQSRLSSWGSHLWLTPRQPGCLCQGGALETSGGDWGPPWKCIVRDRTSLLAFWRVKPRPGQQQPAPHIKARGPGGWPTAKDAKSSRGVCCLRTIANWDKEESVNSKHWGGLLEILPSPVRAQV